MQGMKKVRIKRNDWMNPKLFIPKAHVELNVETINLTFADVEMEIDFPKKKIIGILQFRNENKR
jgi:hypothetical protein